MDQNVISRFIWGIYYQIIFYFHYLLYIIQKPFYKNTNDSRFERKTIINNLLENFTGEESNLINPNESVETTFSRMIDKKDYNSAMKLAKKFDFDTDLIYKNMWQCNEIDIELIDECLTKISKHLWSLNQCINCIPHQLDVLKYLLQFGIRISSKECLNSYLINENDELKINNLTEEGLEFLRHRKYLIHYLKRLIMYEETLKKKYLEYSLHFDSNYFDCNYRNKSTFQLAIYFANEADLVSLDILLKQEYITLEKHLLVIMSNLPETISPTEYQNILDIVFLNLSNEKLDISSHKSDWSDYFGDPIQNLFNNDFESNFYEEHPFYLNYKINFCFDKDIVTLWLQERALEIFDFTSLIENSLKLLNFGIVNGLQLKDLYTELDLYSLLLNDSNQNLIPFGKFKNFTLIEKMNTILGKNDAIYVIENTFEKFIEKLFNYGYDKKFNITKKDLMKEFLINIAKNDFSQCLKIFELCTMVDKTPEEIKCLTIIKDPCELIELAIDCINAYKDAGCLNKAFKIMECLPDRNQAEILFDGDLEKIKQFNQINDVADRTEYYLSMIEVLQDYNTELTVNTLNNIINNTSKLEQQLFFDKIINNFFTVQFDDSDVLLEWKNFFWNLQDLRKNCLDLLSTEELTEMCVTNLLFSANNIFIKIGINSINFNSNVSKTKVNIEKGKQLIKQAANDYIKFSNPIEDENIKFAKMCIEVFEKYNIIDEESLEELEFIKGLDLLYDQFHLSMLPIKIKHTSQPRLCIIESILSSSKKAYTKITDILKISQLLRVCKDYSIKEREGIIMSMIGKEAIEQVDYPIAFQICKSVIEQNLKSAWDLCHLFAAIPNQDEGITINQKLALLSFALAHTPESNVESLYQILNMIKSIKSVHNVQMANQKVFINFRGDLCLNKS